MTQVPMPVKLDTPLKIDRNLGLLHPGAQITLEISTPAGQKAKFRTIFIGYLPKQYVLVQYPDASKLGRFASLIAQGMGVTVRGLIEGREGAVVAFVSSIKQTLQNPSRIMVLDFPQKVSLLSLRANVRIDTEITAFTTINKEKWQTQIKDLSISGCQLFITNGEQLVLANDNHVDIIIETFQQLSQIKLTANICNIRQLNEGISIGVKFIDDSKEKVEKLLHSAITAAE